MVLRFPYYHSLAKIRTRIAGVRKYLLILNSSSESELDDSKQDILFYFFLKNLNYLISTFHQRKRRGQFKIRSMMSDADSTNYVRMILKLNS